MKKLAAITVIILLVSLCGCSTVKESEITITPTVKITAEPTPEPTEEPTASPIPEPTPVPYGPYSAVDPSVFEFPYTMMKEKDFQIIAEGIRPRDEQYAILSLKAINTSLKDLDLHISGITINGCKVPLIRGIFMGVPAGKESVTALWLDFDTAKLYNIKTMNDIKFAYLVNPSDDIYTNTYMGVASITGSTETVPFEVGGVHLIESGKYLDVYLYDAGINKDGREYYEILLYNKSKHIQFYLIESLTVSGTAIKQYIPAGGTLIPGAVCIFREDRNRGAMTLLDDEGNISSVEILVTGHHPFTGYREYTIDAVYEAES